MKYLAVLKDSLREALDSKVLYVLFALSTLVIVFVATLSFQPQPAQKTMEQFFFAKKSVPLAIVLNSHKPEKQKKDGIDKMINALMRYKLEKVEQISGEPDSPQGTYVLTIHESVGAAKAGGIEGVRDLFREAEDLGYVMIKDAQHVDGAAPHYRVTLEGTSRFLRVWAAQPKLFFGTLPIGEFAAPLGYQLYLLTAVVLSIGTWVALLVGVVITSFFIPNMLRKGTVDLLLVKPIQRWVLLFYKYIGGLTFIFFSTVYALGGMWLVLGIRTGLWANWALLLIVTITFFFAILYAISTFVAVVTRSTVTAIMVTLFAWFIFFGIGTANKIFADQYQVEEVRKKAREAQQIKPADGEEDEGWGHSQGAWIIFGLHKVMPRTSDLNQINDLIVFCDFLTGSLDDMDTFDTTKPNRWESLIVSALWITVFLGLASAWFTFKDY